MAPSAISDASAPLMRNPPKPPPARIWSVSDPPFEGYRPVDGEGYARSNHETAIVIDNGALPMLPLLHVSHANKYQARLQSAPAGRSTRSRAFRSCPTWPGTETAS
jgi:hypothetical protein